MKAINCIKTGSVAILVSAFAITSAGAKPGMLGKMGPEEFKKTNMEAGMKVKALTPDGKKLSDSDTDLLKEIAAGGMMQLEIAKVAVKMASSEDVKLIAEAEVAEQTALGDKVKEIAGSGGAALPENVDQKTTEMISMLKSKSGLELDKSYLKESGIHGHEILEKTMEKVSSKAENQTLKSLALTALPLIKSHLQIAKDEAADMD
jgi:putative membrane protein